MWCQFDQTISYYPALLAYLGSTLAYVIHQRLASNGVYTAAIIIVLFWGGVLVGSRGSGLVAKLSSSWTMIGTLVPGVILVVLGAVYLLQGNQSAAPMNVHHLLPAWNGLASIVLVVNSFFVYAVLGADYDQSPYTQTGDRVADLAARGVRLVIEEFRTEGQRIGECCWLCGTASPLAYCSAAITTR